MNIEKLKTNIYLGLVHHPIKNKRGDLVTTSVTNLDIHDIARSCRTFGFQRYFIVTPLKLYRFEGTKLFSQSFFLSNKKATLVNSPCPYLLEIS